ncbi:FadR family transcriptional regulator [Peribacillus saganii]|uniref:FadR family transcriptional regulator n=1 Tax=Peribacillus saganii TaxID=2303992 RepID=A0A372LSM3_9BACI|nr:FadR/GntR family transcriptional regulator [Peribacillus saganii]RFU70907.1 FadR family transcriptional regulator [Peribacillus saganii]
MNVEKIAVKKLSETVEEQIEKMISSGTFKPGEKLPSVRELCELFGVGRSAVRDAITTLKGKGIVNVRQGEGTYICEFDSAKLFSNAMLLPNARDISELFQVRKILESGMAEMAAINRSEIHLQIMTDLLSAKTASGWESDYQFHSTIALATGNEILVELVKFISTTMKKVMMDFHRYIQNSSNIVDTIDTHHKEIYESIRNKEPREAKANMLAHLDFVEQLLKSDVLQ